jgi:hypothetical protein
VYPVLPPHRPFGDFFKAEDVAAGADDVRVLVAVVRVDVVRVDVVPGRVDVVMLPVELVEAPVELVAGALGIGIDAEEAHFPRRGLQPVPQWSALEPHQPYLSVVSCMLSTNKEINLLRATLALKVASARVAVCTTTRTILGYLVCGAGSGAGCRSSR